MIALHNTVVCSPISTTNLSVRWNQVSVERCSQKAATKLPETAAQFAGSCLKTPKNTSLRTGVIIIIILPAEYNELCGGIFQKYHTFALFDPPMDNLMIPAGVVFLFFWNLSNFSLPRGRFIIQSVSYDPNSPVFIANSGQMVLFYHLPFPAMCIRTGYNLWTEFNVSQHFSKGSKRSDRQKCCLRGRRSRSRP